MLTNQFERKIKGNIILNAFHLLEESFPGERHSPLLAATGNRSHHNKVPHNLNLAHAVLFSHFQDIFSQPITLPGRAVRVSVV